MKILGLLEVNGRSWRVALSLLVALTTMQGTADAKSPKRLNPLDSVEEVAIDVLIGNSVDSAHRPWIFEGEAQRAEELRSKIKSGVEFMLREAGLAVVSNSDNAEDGVYIRIFGHQDRLALSSAVTVFLIDISLVDQDYSSERPCEGDRDLVQDIQRIGVAQTEDLEATIETEILNALEPWIPRK